LQRQTNYATDSTLMSFYLCHRVAGARPRLPTLTVSMLTAVSPALHERELQMR